MNHKKQLLWGVRVETKTILLAGTHLDNARVALVCLCPGDPPAAARAVRATCTCES